MAPGKLAVLVPKWKNEHVRVWTKEGNAWTVVARLAAHTLALSLGTHTVKAGEAEHDVCKMTAVVADGVVGWAWALEVLDVKGLRTVREESEPSS